MPFNEPLATRVRECLGTTAGVVEKRMFGGLAFLVGGHMSVGVHGDELIVRIDPDETDSALQERGVRMFDVTRRPMKGWLLVAASAVEQRKSLEKWVGKCVAYAQSLPPK